MLLPYIDQGALYDNCNFNIGIIGDGPTESLNVNNTMQIIPAFRCPSDIDPTATWYSMRYPGNNYALSLGTTTEWANSNNAVGMFGFNKSIRFRDALDGLSNTIAMAEICVGRGSYDIHSSVVRNVVWPGGNRQNPGVAAIQAYGQAIQAAYAATPSNTHHHAGRLWALGQHSQSLFNTTAPPNWAIPNGQECSGCGWMDSNGIFASRSRHAGGSQHLFADGSVHFISSSIDMGLYQALGTRAEGEVVQFP